MKLLARLTLRSLIQNRWRSLATMIAITLSTLMLVSVTTLASSTMDALKHREIDTGGNWHTLYQGVAATRSHRSKRMSGPLPAPSHRASAICRRKRSIITVGRITISPPSMRKVFRCALTH